MKIKINKKNLAVASFLFFTIAYPEIAAAAPWDGMAQRILDALNNGFVRLVAIISIIGLGLSALFGFLKVQRAGMIIGGIVLIFGAAAIADFLIAGVSAA